jgi:hypothetical protein
MYTLQSGRFSSERELQDYCIRVLRSKGIHCKAEVWNGDIRADIVTSRAVIECKKILDRDSIYQAYGQAQAYRQNLKREEIWIVGQYPIDLRAKEQAIKIAQEIEKNANVTVSFIDDDEFWNEDYQRGEWATWRYICLFMGILFLLLALTRWNHKKCPATSQSFEIHQTPNSDERVVLSGSLTQWLRPNASDLDDFSDTLSVSQSLKRLRGSTSGSI